MASATNILPNSLSGALREARRRGVESMGDAGEEEVLRRLTVSQIEGLEQNGNRCADWSLLRVGGAFDPDRIHSVRFVGRCLIVGHSKSPRTAGGIGLPLGIYDSLIVDSYLGFDCMIYRCRMISGYWIGERARLVDASLGVAGETCFGNGIGINAGNENGGRWIEAVADLTLEPAVRLLSRMADRALQGEHHGLVADYCRACRSRIGYVGPDVEIVGGSIENCWIGAGASVCGATLLEEATILSSSEEPTTIGSGAILRHALVQHGCVVNRHAILERSLLMEYGLVSCHAKIQQSIIGPNTQIESGEVSSSLIGPFVVMHHQSLLISAYWPGGRGNIGYGANVGSNHTSRVADQESLPGEGMFFGLSCAIKYPANFSESPYTIIASGVTTMPQRVSFPFSLIMPHERPLPNTAPTINRLIPAWNLSNNLYNVIRSWIKHERRNLARRHTFQPHLFSPTTRRLMAQALERLEGVTTPSQLYRSDDIEGIGENIVYEADRLKAIESYRFFIAFARCSDPETRRAMGTKILHRVVSSRERDYRRGRQIIPDYDDTHPPIEQDPIIIECRRRFVSEGKYTEQK